MKEKDTFDRRATQKAQDGRGRDHLQGRGLSLCSITLSVCFRVFPWLSFYLGFNHAFRDFRVIPWLR